MHLGQEVKCASGVAELVLQLQGLLSLLWAVHPFVHSPRISWGGRPEVSSPLLTWGSATQLQQAYSQKL